MASLAHHCAIMMRLFQAYFEPKVFGPSEAEAVPELFLFDNHPQLPQNTRLP